MPYQPRWARPFRPRSTPGHQCDPCFGWHTSDPRFRSDRKPPAPGLVSWLRGATPTRGNNGRTRLDREPDRPHSVPIPVHRGNSSGVEIERSSEQEFGLIGCKWSLSRRSDTFQRPCDYRLRAAYTATLAPIQSSWNEPSKCVSRPSLSWLPRQGKLGQGHAASAVVLKLNASRRCENPHEYRRFSACALPTPC